MKYMPSLELSRAITLGELFREACRMYSSNRAYAWRPMFRTLSWTYEDIWNHAAAFADILKEHGVQKGDRVILIGFNSPFWVAAFFGIQLRGAIAVPLSSESTSEFIQKIIRQTEAKVILKNRFAPTQGIPILTMVMESIPKPLSNHIPIDIPALDENDIAEIVYTSGTTGDPKGVILTHKNLLSNLWSSKKAIPVDHTMRFVSILPLFHMFEQIGGLLVPLSAGAQVSYAASLNPNHLRWIFQDDQVNRMLAVPEFLRLIYLRIKERAKEEGKLERLEQMLKISRLLPMPIRKTLFGRIHREFGWNLHTIASGGAALEKEVGEFWEGLGIYILQGYGLTETSPVLTVNRYRDRKVDSVGKPLEGVEVKLAEDGEILAKGPNIFPGYWNNEEKTKEVFDEQGWFRTGDIGFFDRQGHLHIKGRKKFMIVLPSGENVYAEDIESELNKEIGIIDSAVLGLKKDAGEEVHAVLLLNKDETVEPEAIIAHVNNRLLPYQRIQSFSVWPSDDFPRTPTRKVKKPEVISQVLSQLEGQTTQSTPLPSFSRLERIIAQVLEVPSQNIQDDKRLVADFNLDSLRRIELVARIENELSVSVDESEITQQTTVKDLKTIVEKKHQKQIRYPFNPKPFTTLIQFIRDIMQPLFFKTALFLFAPTEIRGKENLKNLKHPVLFFSNHLGAADTPLIYGTLPARLRRKLAVAAASDAVYENQVPLIKRSRIFLETLFPIYPFIRQGDQTKSSFEYTGRIIDRGYSVLLFPEGKISRAGELQQLKQGAGLLGIEMGVSIVPIKLQGTQKIISPGSEAKPPMFYWPKRHKVTVTFGQPFTVDPKMSYREATSFIEKKMKSL